MESNEDISEAGTMSFGSLDDIRLTEIDVSDDDDRDDRNATCDFYFCAPRWAQRLRRKGVMRALFVWSCLAESMLASGFLLANITNIERRLGLRSLQSGIFIALHDVGVLITLGPISCLGRKVRRNRLIAYGMLVVSLASFLISLIHFNNGYYVYKISTKPLCYRNVNVSYENLCDGDDLNPRRNQFLLLFSSFLIGVGTSPLKILGISFAMDNLNSNYLTTALLSSFRFVGPSVGFLLTGFFAEFYVDVDKLGKSPTDITPDDQLWIGAWWIGFLISSVMNLVSFPFFFSFPDRLPGENREDLDIGDDLQQLNKYQRTSFQEMEKKLRRLGENATFIHLTVAKISSSIVVTGILSFGPKYLEEHFALDSRTAVKAFGLAIIPFAGLGSILGGVLVDHYRMKIKGLLRAQAVAASFLLPLIIFAFILTCSVSKEPFPWAGITTTYFKDMETKALEDACNSGCQCQTDRLLFYPICGTNNKTFASPCYAGCMSSNSTQFYNCTCVEDLKDEKNFSDAASGQCHVTCEKSMLFIVTLSVCAFVHFLTDAMSVVATLQCVRQKDRHFAFGLQDILVRIFANIPGPIVLGWFFDLSCVLWSLTCSDTLHCQVHNATTLRKWFMFFCIVPQYFMTISYAIASFVYKPEKGRRSLPALRSNQQYIYFRRGVAAGNRNLVKGPAREPGRKSWMSSPGRSSTSSLPQRPYRSNPVKMPKAPKIPPKRLSSPESGQEEPKRKKFTFRFSKTNVRDMYMEELLRALDHSLDADEATPEVVGDEEEAETDA